MRLARSGDCALLPEIERAAGAKFADFDFLSGIDDVGSIEWFEEAQSEGLLWVAADEVDAPVAFALFEPLGEGLHLEEVDVHPDHGRNGLGARLIDAGAARARELGHREITLTTFREIPWNAPYYERLGFRVVARERWSPVLVARVADEARKGLDPEKRVVMRRRIDDDSSGGADV